MLGIIKLLIELTLLLPVPPPALPTTLLLISAALLLLLALREVEKRREEGIVGSDHPLCRTWRPAFCKLAPETIMLAPAAAQASIVLGPTPPST